MPPPMKNISFEIEGGYLVIARIGPKWVIAPFEEYSDAEKHAEFLEAKWGGTYQVHILRNVKTPADAE